MTKNKNINTSKFWDKQFEDEFDIVFAKKSGYYRWRDEQFAHIGNAVPAIPGIKLLDYGCGLGHFCRYLESRYIFAEVAGTDFSPKAIELAQKIAPGLFLFVSNSKQVDTKDESFGFISCIELIEHLKKPEDLLKEFARVIEKKGVVALTTPIFNPEKGVKSHDHVQEYTPITLKALCEKYFDDVDISIPFYKYNPTTRVAIQTEWQMAICRKPKKNAK